jgi:hypothetical protein
LILPRSSGSVIYEVSSGLELTASRAVSQDLAPHPML